MLYQTDTEQYCAEEIAVAAGVPVARVALALGGGDRLVSFAEAVRVGRALAVRTQAESPSQLFSIVLASDRPPQPRRFPVLLSLPLHCTLPAVAVFVARWA